VGKMWGAYTEPIKVELEINKTKMVPKTKIFELKIFFKITKFLLYDIQCIYKILHTVDYTSLYPINLSIIV